jgi:hypothetical protein
MKLSPESDRTVRLAVSAYLAGELCSQLEGEILFSTRNHTYRLIDGVLFNVGEGPHQEVGDARSLLGAELVGWLHEGAEGNRVDLEWRPGARGVLVDPRRNQHIIVTSATRSASRTAAPRPAPQAAEPGSGAYQVGSAASHPAWQVVPATAPPPADASRSELRPRAPAPTRDDESHARKHPVHPPPRPIRQQTQPPRQMGPLPAPTPPPVRYASPPPPTPEAWGYAAAAGAGVQRGMRLR